MDYKTYVLVVKPLVEQGFISLTKKGKDLAKIYDKKEQEEDSYEKMVEHFTVWWNKYPSKSPNGRGLRIAKSKCFNAFVKLSKLYNPEKLIHALESEIAYRQKNRSLDYMKASLTYLNQEAFLPYLDDKKPSNAEVYI